jgi:hypothetical protein
MRVFCFVIDNQASDVSQPWDALAGSCLHGTLTSSDDIRRAVIDPAWIKAVTDSKLAVVLVGEEWKPALPPRFRGTCAGDASDPLAKRLTDVENFSLNEPWELLAVWLPVSSPSDTNSLTAIRPFLTKLPPDVGVIGVLLDNPKSKIQNPKSNWLCSAPKLAASDAGPRPIQDVLVTMLAWLGVNPPKPFKGERLELSPEKTSGYSPAEEREIQKRLEDLGYL